MNPDEIKALRKELSCSAKELAGALGIDQLTVLAWEKAELFPTKAFIDRMAELRAKGYGFYASGALESLTRLTYDEIVEQEIGFIGTPEKIIQQIRALETKGGIGELAIVSNFGGLEHWKSIKIQHMFAKHVMPAFRGAGKEAKAAD